VRLCFERFEDSLKPFPQTGHFKGFNPEWTRWCIAGKEVMLALGESGRRRALERRIYLLKALGYLNALLQMLHTNGFSLLWMNMC
jgi:hypothetical protein